mgnify:CR=1 FL=1
MKGIWKRVICAVLAFTGCAFCGSQAVPADGLPQSALVVVMSHYVDGVRGGNGFVVGDGTLVVTCDHLIYGRSEKGDYRAERLPVVVSPHLGWACDARILASDEGLDLSVLEVPWKGHPSLTLADANAVLGARSARIVGLAGMVKRWSDWDAAGSPEDFEAQEEEMQVVLGGMHARVPRSIMLSGTGRVGPGWSGSAMVLPGTSTAIGCFSAIHAVPKDEQTPSKQAMGPAVCQVAEFLRGRADASRLCRADGLLKRPDDARDAYVLALRASSYLRSEKYESALEPAHAFIELRPDCSYGHKVLAYANDKLGRVGVARESYRRAMELDPNSLHCQLLYAQLLTDYGDPNQARQILEPLWQAGRSRGPVAISLVNLWRGRNEFSRCLEILEEATQAEPRNSYLWRLMACCRGLTQGPTAAIELLTRAVELRPEEGPTRGMLAQMLELMGNLDEAEKHFRTLLDVESTNPVVYCWLAQFLSKHRPGAAQEALKLAEKALELPAHPSLPREKIEQLIAMIQGQIGANSQN